MTRLHGVLHIVLGSRFRFIEFMDTYLRMQESVKSRIRFYKTIYDTALALKVNPEQILIRALKSTPQRSVTLRS